MKNHRTLLALATSAILFSAGCTAFLFKHEQPSNMPTLQQVPAALIGHYYGIPGEGKEKTKKGDSLVIEFRQKEILYDERSWRSIPLSDTAAIRRYKQRQSNPKMAGGKTYDSYVKGDTAYVCTHKKFTFHLGKELTMRSFGKNYCVNMRDTVDRGTPQQKIMWTVLVLAPDSAGNLGLCAPTLQQHPATADSLRSDSSGVKSVLMDKETALAYYSKMAKITPKDPGKNKSGGDYILDPTPAQLQKLYDKGFFVEAVQLHRVK